jgi:hypothetical protein
MLRPLPPGYNPGRPRPRPIVGSGITGPRQGIQQPRPGIPSQGFPVGPRQIQQPGMQQQGPIGLPRGPIFLPRPDGTLQNMHPAAGGIRPGMQQAPMQQFSYGGRAGYQMGGGIMGLENGQEESIFPRIENLSQNLGQAEQTLGAPSNDQFNASSITTAITGRPQMNRGGRMGYPKTGIGSLANRQGYFLGDIVGGIGDLAGDIFGGIGDIGGDILGSVGDVLGDLDLGELMQIYQVAAPFVGLPPMPGGEFASFLPGSVPGGEGGLGSLGNILGNFGSFMPQEGGDSGFNPYQFASNLISNNFPNEDDPNNEGRGGSPMDTVSIITNLLRKFLTPESIAGTAATTVGKLTYDEMKRLNALREKEFAEYKEGKAKKKTQYRTTEGRETLPGYEVTGVPQTTADVFRAPAMRGGIMNVPTGQPRRNAVGVKEIDYRQSGGFVPPIGVKEKADDIPAMLSNNEFVFTADAVRAAGGGSVNKGAQKMYGLMKQLEGRI